MAPIAAVRPENVLKTCENLIKVNNSDEALSILKNFIGAKRFKYISAPAAESIGLLFVELCVKKRDFKLAKEGLFNFKKNVQTINNGLDTVGTVLRRYIQLGEAALNEAKANAASAATEDNVVDLDEVKAPEVLLLSIVSSDDTKDRSDRELLTPYLRFMFDSYRSVLEIIRNTKQLEIVYCYVASQSFKFCEQFGRTQEFKKLSEVIRNHLQSINFYANQSYTNSFNAQNQIDLSNPSTLERFLQLRFNGLNIAVKMELYQESFKIIVDIHTLLVYSKRHPKPSMMLNYYENLAKIFNVSDNTLYRSVAWLKFFNLYSQSPNATLENLRNYASIIVLSSLSISETADSNNEDDKQKYLKLSRLLNLSEPPSRDSVIDSINTPNFLKFVDKDLKILFNFLENNDFNPLFIQSELVPILDKIYKTPNYKAFFRNLLDTVVLKIFQQVAKNYENIKFDFLIDLATFKGTEFEISAVVIENSLINAGKEGLLPQFRIDHAANVISFINDPFNVNSSTAESTAADLIKVQLSNLSNTLLKSLYNTDASYIEKQRADKARAVELANQELEQERQEIEERRIFFEKKRQEEAEEESRRAEAERKLREEKLAAERKAEKERQEQEAQRRAEEKEAKKIEEIRELEKMKIAEDINKAGIIYIDVNEIKDIDIDQLRKMQLDQLTKDQLDTQENLKAVFKRNDHLERAFRKYELKLLEEDEKVQKQKDIENYNSLKAKLTEKAKKGHEESIKLRDRLQRVVPTYKSYVSKINASREEEIEKLKAKAAAALQKEKEARIQRLKEQELQALVRAKQEEEERRRREEEEAKTEAKRREEEAAAEAKREQEEKKKKEEIEKLRSEMAAQRAKDEAALARQRELEAQVEKRLAEKNRPAPSGGRFGNAPSRNFSYGGRSNSNLGDGPKAFSSSSPAPRSGESSASPSPAPAGGKPLTFAERMRLKRQQQQQ